MNVHPLLLAVATLSSLILSTPQQSHAKDMTYARVECPEKTVTELCWRDKIGSDPTLSADGQRCAKSDIKFVSKSRQGQKVVCKYSGGTHADGSAISKTYSYTIGRKIIEVVKEDAASWEFKVEEK